jgi:hypothetical protein
MNEYMFTYIVYTASPEERAKILDAMSSEEWSWYVRRFKEVTGENYRL